MDKNNAIIKLFHKGMQEECVGSISSAQELFVQAWDEASNDWEKCIAAHFVARNLSKPEDKLKWNLESLSRADKVHNDEIKTYYPSLYLNIGLSYEILVNYAEARKY